jgi:hypothetical protein
MINPSVGVFVYGCKLIKRLSPLRSTNKVYKEIFEDLLLPDGCSCYFEYVVLNENNKEICDKE